MKHLKTITLTALSCILLACACEMPEPPLTLPEATQEGVNTFGCLVNGEVWLKGGGFSYPRPNWTIYIGIDGFGFTAQRFGDHIFEIVNINIFDSTKVGEFVLNNINDAKFSDRSNGCNFTTDSLVSNGILHVTKYDTINKIFSGTFHFQAVKYESESGICDTLVSITEGRFDVNYNDYEHY